MTQRLVRVVAEMEEDYNELNVRYNEMVAAGKSGEGIESVELMEVSSYMCKSFM